MTPADREWTQKELRAHLRKQGWTQDAIRVCGTIPQWVTGHSMAPPTARILAWAKQTIAEREAR